MKKLNKILYKLNSAFAVERDVTDVTMMQETTPPLPWSVDTNTGAMCCGLSEWDFVEATLCAEAGGCSEAQRQRVWAVIMNRAIARGSAPLKRGVCNFTGYAREVIRDWQFSCWNTGGDGDCADGVDAFASCENLRKRVECLKKRCGSRRIPRGQYTSTSGHDFLEQLGFTPNESTRVKHYMTVEAFIGWKHMCKAAKDKVRALSKGLNSWVGCTTVKCKGKTYKICSDGCHLYISGFN